MLETINMSSSISTSHGNIVVKHCMPTIIYLETRYWGKDEHGGEGGYRGEGGYMGGGGER